MIVSIANHDIQHHTLIEFFLIADSIKTNLTTDFGNTHIGHFRIIYTNFMNIEQTIGTDIVFFTFRAVSIKAFN